MPEAMVIPAPWADIKVVADKKLIGLSFAIVFIFQYTIFSFDEHIQFGKYHL